MHLYLHGNDFHFELENVCRLFLPLEKIVTHHDEEPTEIDGLIVECMQTDLSDRVQLTCRVRLDGFDECSEATVDRNTAELQDVCEDVLHFVSS